MINQDCKPGTQQFCFHLYQVWASELKHSYYLRFSSISALTALGLMFFHDTLSCRCEALQKTVHLFCRCGAIGLTVFDCLKDPTTAIILKKKKNFFRVSPFHVSLAHIQSLSPRHKTNSDSGPVPIYTGFLCALSNVGFGGAGGWAWRYDIKYLNPHLGGSKIISIYGKYYVSSKAISPFSKT